MTSPLAQRLRASGLALNDFSKLRIESGVIHYRLYRQDGTFQPMTCRDTQSNRLFVSWVQKFDRYTEVITP